MLNPEQINALVVAMLQRGGKITIELPAPEVEVGHHHPTTVRYARPDLVFPDHPVMPTKPLVFDDSELAGRPIKKCPDDCPCNSCKAEAAKAINPVGPAQPFSYEKGDLLDIARGKRPNSCWGCNEDDRGFVVVVGCPVHHSPNKKD